MKTYKRTLTIAGSDSGGGAGIQADIKTISACGCFATSAITAITAQNTEGVFAIHAIPPEIVEKQIQVVIDDIGTDSVKIGMLNNSETTVAVKRALSKYDINKIVLDPVMVSTSGHKLLEDDAIQTLIEQLFPLCHLITPNIPEAELLLGRKITSQEEFPDTVKELAEKFNLSVYLKAGHLDGDSFYDMFYHLPTKSSKILHGNRVKTVNTHGTGCSLSSAIAAFGAKHDDINVAVEKAHQYIQKAIFEGKDYKIGNGHGPINHFFEILNK